MGTSSRGGTPDCRVLVDANGRRRRSPREYVDHVWRVEAGPEPTLHICTCDRAADDGAADDGAANDRAANDRAANCAANRGASHVRNCRRPRASIHVHG